METLDLHKHDDGFKPTTEELETIRKKMDDPEFMKLWAEYAQSLADPKYRAEEEEYLRQMEREAQEGGDHSFEFIFPKAVFVVRLLEDGGKRTFLNMCECEKVEPFSESRVADSRDANWHVPIVVGKLRKEEFEGHEVAVYDCVFHPKTISLGNNSNRFMCFLVEIAVENLNAGYQQNFGFEFKRLPVTAIGTPANQTVRKKGKSEPMFPKSTEPASKAPMKPGSSEPVTAPTTSFTQPDVSVAHRGEIDLTDAWNWKQSERRIGVPKELVVKFKLPRLERAVDVDVDITGHSIELLSTSAGYQASVTLPFSVEETPVSAKFDKNKKELQLVLAVVPPQRPVVDVEPPKSNSETEAAVDETADTPSVKEEARATEALVESGNIEAEPEARSESAPAPETATNVEGHSNALADVLARVREARLARESNDAAATKTEAKPEPHEIRVDTSADCSTSKVETRSADAPAEDAPSQVVETIDLRGKQNKTTEAPVVLDDDEEPMSDAAILEAQKKVRADREAEKAAQELAKKMGELPLCSRHIFAID
jgi:dynein assembly factor 2